MTTFATKQEKKALIERLNVFTAFVLGAISAIVVWRLALAFLPADAELSPLFTREDKITLLSMIAWFIGFMTGIGALIGPFRWVQGKDLSHEENMFYAGKDMGIKRYFRYTTDHKVVGIQYLVITMVIFGIGGILAMLIRTNLGKPGGGWIHPQAYNSIVGTHGIIMIVGTIIMVTGPFGNYIMPIMIGARDMAFPRLNALSFWLIVAAAIPLIWAQFIGGISTGWSAYNPLAGQSPLGMDGYIMFICIFACSWHDMESHTNLYLWCCGISGACASCLPSIFPIPSYVRNGSRARNFFLQHSARWQWLAL